MKRFLIEMTGITVACLVLIVLIFGMPRLYGTGCEGRPFGFAMAHEESDFLQPCKAIEAIPFMPPYA